MATQNQPVGPEGWRPEEGDSITGKVTNLDLGWSDHQNASYPIVTLEGDDGTLTSVHAFHAVLQSRLKSARPKLGDRLTITFHGKRETKDGKRTVAVYSVEAPDRGGDAEAFWGPT